MTEDTLDEIARDHAVAPVSDGFLEDDDHDDGDVFGYDADR